MLNWEGLGLVDDGGAEQPIAVVTENVVEGQAGDHSQFSRSCSTSRARCR